MKFSLAAAALCVLSSTSAAAVIDLEPRAPPVTVVGTINASIETVKNTIPTYLSTIGMLLLKMSQAASCQ